MVVTGFVKLYVMPFFVPCPVKGMIFYNVVADCVGAYSSTPLRERNTNGVLDVFETVRSRPCR
jgi:hypothetical protein